MARLTERAALTTCAELWEWLAENQECEKADWPGWKAFEKKYGEAHCDCPCCEYYIEQGHGGCKKCLNSIWPSAEEGADPCVLLGSPYDYWRMGYKREESALKIANAARTELAKMKPLKKRGK
jgi:hypothetical protein